MLIYKYNIIRYYQKVSFFFEYYFKTLYLIQEIQLIEGKDDLRNHKSYIQKKKYLSGCVLHGRKIVSSVLF